MAKEINLQIKNLSKIYDKKTVLNNLNFEVYDGEFLSILGPSGCGKTTLLKILIGIEKPTSGNIIKKNEDITTLDPSKRKMGIVFQNYALFPNMTALKNVEYALKIKYKNKKIATEEAKKMLKIVNMEEHMNKYPHELSGGQQQRTSIGRAIITKPAIILADEPTGNLDSKASEEVVTLLQKMNKDYKQTIIMITHNLEIASYADRIITIEVGKIVKEK